MLWEKTSGFRIDSRGNSPLPRPISHSLREVYAERMPEPLDNPDRWYITCAKCRRTVTRIGGNELVGQQDRFKCEACGHRGAELTRVPVRDPLPPRSPNS